MTGSLRGKIVFSLKKQFLYYKKKMKNAPLEHPD
jgi:hypothetical protein